MLDKLKKQLDKYLKKQELAHLQ